MEPLRIASDKVRDATEVWQKSARVWANGEGTLGGETGRARLASRGEGQGVPGRGGGDPGKGVEEIPFHAAREAPCNEVPPAAPARRHQRPVVNGRCMVYEG